jgi:peptidoglycan LD-endopeptidase CwlK
MNTLNARSEGNLLGVHPDLVSVVRRAFVLVTKQNPALTFIVTEGLRTLARQKQLYASGASKTMNSRHIAPAGGLGHAVDLAPVLNGEVRWDWPLFHQLADAMKAAALELNVPIEWGGDWKTFPDGPHMQLPWREYP